MGLLMADPGEIRMTGASVALRVLAEARRDGLNDDQIKRRSPVVLALTAPHLAGDVELPPDVETPELFGGDGRSTSTAGIVREALRLRVRWLQEITARAAWVIGLRLADSGDLADPADVKRLSVKDLEAIVTGRAQPVPTVLVGPARVPEPLPACFQLTELRRPVSVCRGGEAGGGTGAGGGVGTGVVTYDEVDPPSGSVLVTTTLKPRLGPLLPRLSGIVAETGSVLAHLAILARESRVPTVVGYVGAAEIFSEGMMVMVNGDTGDVTIEESA